MNYAEFKEQFTKKVQRVLQEEGVIVKQEDVTKNNGHHLDALCLTRQNSSIAPNIYIRTYYDQFLEGASVNEIVGRIKQLALREFKMLPELPAINRETAKERLFATVVNAEMNKEMLANTPNRIVEDVAIIPRFKVEVGNDSGSFIVNNKVLNQLQMTKDEVLNMAIANSGKDDFQCKSIETVIREECGMQCDDNEFLEELFPGDESPYMYIVTNSSMSYGAVALVCKGTIERIEEQIGEACYILPSSINELILVPKSKLDDVEYLKSVVYEVNRTTLSPEEYLSDSVYEINPLTKRLQVVTGKTEKEEQRLSKAKGYHM